MHTAAFEALGLQGWVYQRLPAPPEVFDEIVRALPASGFVGANVTIPHKEAALALADTASDAARAIGAANTLTFDAATGAVHADNTDAPGLLDAIGADVTGRSALVLGAGGSARAAAYALREAGAAPVRVWSRTPARAAALADDLGVEAVDDAAPADLLVHCTSIGLDGRPTTFKELPLAADALGAYPTVVDLVYRDGGTELIRAAQAAGCATVDGLEVLVGQGARSFEIWTGRKAPREAMRRGASPSPTHDTLREPPPPAGRPAGG
jgi:shikimate dehydrogenase